MKFKPGIYYVGDLGCVLPSDDLRLIFWDLMRYGKTLSGERVFCNKQPSPGVEIMDGYYWLTNLPSLSGTLHEKNGAHRGFDWKIFGCALADSIENKNSYESNMVEFVEPFECSHVDNVIKIGHLHFSIEP